MDADLDAVFRAERQTLWGLCYRLTGVAADADDLVQEAFARALERPPSTVDSWRLWLVRVATNLSLDHLRARKRRGYPGPWLPSPVETADPGRQGDIETRYGNLEDASFAFLLALETLSPRPRAVLVLRDVFDYSVKEVSLVLGISEANVRILHHRARRRLEARGAESGTKTRTTPDETRRVLERFMTCLVRQDVSGIEALLAGSVRTLTDGGGVFSALRTPLRGRHLVARFHLRAARLRMPGSRFEFRILNGSPAVLVETETRRPRQAPRLVLRCELDSAGQIREIHSILAPRKLTAIRPPVTMRAT